MLIFCLSPNKHCFFEIFWAAMDNDCSKSILLISYNCVFYSHKLFVCFPAVLLQVENRLKEFSL